MKFYKPKNELDKVVASFGATQSDVLKLIGVSRQYAHAVNSGKAFPSLRYQDKMTEFKLMILQVAANSKSVRAPIKNAVCELKAGVAAKKLNDVQMALQQLKQLEDAILLTNRLKETYKPRSLEYDWCVLHLRVLRQKLPKDLELARAAYEAQAAGLSAEIKYWEKRKV
jgi:DNA-binding XRE family transcriptional regulator